MTGNRGDSRGSFWGGRRCRSNFALNVTWIGSSLRKISVFMKHRRVGGPLTPGKGAKKVGNAIKNYGGWDIFSFLPPRSGYLRVRFIFIDTFTCDVKAVIKISEEDDP